MPIKLKDLIAQVPKEVEISIRRLCAGETRGVLQDALRAECRLVLRTPKETEENRKGAQVPVRVSPGATIILEDVEFPDDFGIMLLLSRYRPVLEKAQAGAAGLLMLRKELLRCPNSEQWIQASEPDLQSIDKWTDSLLKALEQHDPLEFLFAISQDIFGVYEYDNSPSLVSDDLSPNWARIKIYWGVIGFVAEKMGCSVDDMALVVLTHELAHAYTQLGADIDGRRWEAQLYALAEKSLTEGLAQYYTERVLRRLEGRFAGALKAFQQILRRQPAEYHAHESWIRDYSPETVRRALLEIRRWKEYTLDDFNRRLASAQEELMPN